MSWGQVELAEDNTVKILGLVCGLLLLYLVVLVALARDVQARRESVPLWLILLHVIGPFAVLIWLCVRPPVRARRRPPADTDDLNWP